MIALCDIFLKAGWVKNILIFVVNRPVGLITDHQVKMAAGKDLPLPVIDRVNTVDHGLVRGKYAVGIVVVLLLHQIGAGQTVRPRMRLIRIPTKSLSWKTAFPPMGMTWPRR